MQNNTLQHYTIPKTTMCLRLHDSCVASKPHLKGMSNILDLTCDLFTQSKAVNAVAERKLNYQSAISLDSVVNSMFLLT